VQFIVIIGVHKNEINRTLRAAHAIAV